MPAFTTLLILEYSPREAVQRPLGCVTQSWVYSQPCHTQPQWLGPISFSVKLLPPGRVTTEVTRDRGHLGSVPDPHPLHTPVENEWASWFPSISSQCHLPLPTASLKRQRLLWLLQKHDMEGWIVFCQGRKCGFDPWVGKIPWRRKWQPAPIFLPGKSHGQRSLVGCSPLSHKELDTT